MLESVLYLSDLAGYGYLLLTMAAVNLLPPLPAEMTIPFAAALFDHHHLRVALAITAATLGLVCGTLPLYYLGRLMGEARFKAFLRGRGRWLLITPQDIDRSGRWFRRYGVWLVMIGRLIPGMRSMISVPAGFHRMRLGRFLVFTTLGSLLWASALVLLGRWVADALLGMTALRIGLGLLAVAIGLYIVRFLRLLRGTD
ncbi:DedA family protein [Salinisphaera sp. Q1T1-3]|uniref:DedA family protein n=1 Tax=Salinisphaera sp. Q1T1-3 TaxID=2321229 RepID=UPI000E720EB0|nr:DedA family protein [Salinisphaera sp. Q1T1-3]RJS94144.1 DedA family protein [Salinisphaera sp. Q1T1-3]